MKLAVAQLRISNDKQENLRKILAYAARAAEQKADMIIFPEMAQGVAARGEAVQPGLFAESLDGPFVSALRQAARARGIYIACGIFERQEGDSRPYNTLIVLDKAGELMYRYRKTHLYDTGRYRESDFIRPGEEAPRPLKTEFGILGFFACYELRFPEIARGLALRGAEALFVPTAWVKGSYKREQLRIFARARAVENGVFVAVADQCGNAYCGGSGLYTPTAIALAEAEPGGEEALLMTEPDFELGCRIRRYFPALRQRRPELYDL